MHDVKTVYDIFQIFWKKHFNISNDIRKHFKRFQNKCPMETYIRVLEYNEDFLHKFADKVDWSYISRNKTLSEILICKFADKVDWSSVSRNKTLSQNVIRKHPNKVDCSAISKYQYLSDGFILEFKNKIDWPTQTLSEIFINKILLEKNDSV